MKLLFTLLTSFFLSTVLKAQAPAQINYQGVARNSLGIVIPNQSISVRLTVHDGSASGASLYFETRTVKTNNFGLFTIGIGSAGTTASSGSLSAVDWSTGGEKYLEVEMDPKGGSSFLKMGAAQLLSVPYSFYAASAAPAGKAGGSLSGNYPNPGIAAKAIGTAQIADSSITASKLAPGVLLGGGGGNPSGTAAGDLTGTYPAPSVAAGAIGTTKLADKSVTAAKLATGVIPATLPPSGAASGDLSGSYPSPVVNSNAITNSKIADGAVSLSKMAAGVIPTALPPNGTAGGDLSGTFPNPVVKTSGITNTKIADGAVSLSKLAAGVIPTALPPNGTAGGDLSGSFPNPVVNSNAITTSKIADGAVSLSKLATGIIPTTLPPSGNAGGNLTGTYPNPTIAASAVTNAQIADNAISTAKVQDGAITAAKLAPGLVPGGSTPTGSAGGDLSGTYPNPSIGAHAITNSKIADGAVTTPTIADGAVTNKKIADGSVTLVKFAAGVIPDSLPPKGNAGGDLAGKYPVPSVVKLQGVAIGNTVPTSGQVLKYNGSAWAPGTDLSGAFALPYNYSAANATNLFSVTNSGTAAAMEGINSSANPKAIGILGKISSTTASDSATAIRGINSSASSKGMAIWGSHSGAGKGVYGTSVSGEAIRGESTSGYGMSASSISGTGLFATSNDGSAGLFDISNSSSTSDAVFVSNAGNGNGITSIATFGNGLLGISNDAAGTGLIGINNGGGEAIVGFTVSDVASGVVGRNDGKYAGVRGFNNANGGIGILALANSNGATGGNALVAEIEGSSAGNTAVFKANAANVARIDQTGKGFFNGGTQVGGADVAEFFDVEGNINQYEAGDVLVISQQTDRTVEKSTTSYSNLISGVYATKPGVLLTEKNAEKNRLQNMVPMGVIGVLPTKVCMEGGKIKRGDFIVTSSMPGVAMKGDQDKIKVGQVLGKALQDFDSNSVGIINVLVSVK